MVKEEDRQLRTSERNSEEDLGDPENLATVDS